MSPPTTTNAPDLRIRRPGDLLEAIPYLLGFHPRQSLVLVGLAGSHVVVSVRADISDVLAGAAGAQLLANTTTIMARGGATALVAAIYLDGAERDGAERDGAERDGAERDGAERDGAELDSPGTHPAESGPDEQADAIGAQLFAATEAAELDVFDVLVVVGERWRSLGCPDEQCCPPEGKPLPGDTSPAAAAATYAGLVALADRADLFSVLDPLPEGERTALEPVLAEYENSAVAAVLDGRSARHQRSVKRAVFAAARDADQALYPGARGRLDDDEICRYAVALLETSVRDSVWMALDQRRIDGRDLWLAMARRLPPPYDAAPLFLFGWSCWRQGNAALAGLAAARALESDPSYRAAELLDTAVLSGLNPHLTPRLRAPRRVPAAGNRSG